MISESYLALARYLDEYRSVRESLTAQGTSSVRLYMIQRKGIAAKQVINEVIDLLTERNSKFWNQFVQGVAQALVHEGIGNFPEIILEDFQVTSSPGNILSQLIATGTITIEGKLVIEVGGYTPGPLPSPDLVFGWSVQARYEDRILSIAFRFHL